MLEDTNSLVAAQFVPAFLFAIDANDFSFVTRKPVFGVCDHVRLKPACATTETS